jgi:AcrR family transcriptional regulator
MAPPLQPERRRILLEGTVEFLLDHGVRGFSLTPLADSLGTSPRMLLYHFGSKDQLVDDAITAARRHQRSMFEEWLTPRAGVPYAVVLAESWRHFERPEAQRYNRLFSELAALSRQPGSRFSAFGPRTVHDWLPLAIEAFRKDGLDQRTAEDHATLALATMRGLIMDLSATGEAARIRRASAHIPALFAPPRN